MAMICLLFLADHDLLLLGGLQFVVGLGLGAQALYSVHNVCLLINHGVAQLLRRIDLRVHHLENGRCRYQ